MNLDLRGLKKRILDGVVQEVDFGQFGKAKLILCANPDAQQRKMWTLRANRAKELGVKENELPPDMYLELAQLSHIGTNFLGWTDDVKIQFGDDEGAYLVCRNEDGSLNDDAMALFLSLPPIRTKVMDAIGDMVRADKEAIEGKAQRSSSKSTGK